MDKRKAVGLAKKFLRDLPEDIQVKKAFLFGSFAKGNSHKDSDVDIALVLGGEFDTFDMTVKLMRLRRALDTGIEPHPIHENDFNKSNPLANEIIKFGILLT
jgi:uncharacterized protein